MKLWYEIGEILAIRVGFFVKKKKKKDVEKEMKILYNMISSSIVWTIGWVVFRIKGQDLCSLLMSELGNE